MNKKILFLTPSLPYPAQSGGKIKSFRLWEYLQENFNADFLCLLPHSSLENTTHLESFQTNFPRSKIFSFICHRPRTAMNFAKSLFACLPLSVYRNYSEQVQQWMDESCHRYDAIFVDHFLMAQYIPKSFKGKVIFHQHNAEFLMWKRYAALMPFFGKDILKKLILSFEAWRIARYELKKCRLSHAILVAPNDQVALQELAQNDKFPFVQTMHLADEKLLEVERHFPITPGTILYVGTLSWEANWDGLLWFLENVWNKFQKQNTGARLRLIGKANDFQLSVLRKFPNVEVLGFVDDLNEEFDRAQLFIAPLRFGSGMKVKVIEAMYRGMPILTTSIGAEGIGATHLQELVIADSAEEQLQHLNNLINKPDLCIKLGHQAHVYSQSSLNWNRVFEGVEEALSCL